MRLAVLNINQSASIALGMDIIDNVIIDWLMRFISSGKMECHVINGVPYYWVSFGKIVEDLPILGIGERQAARRINAMIDKGILEGVKIATKGGLKVFIRVLPDAYDQLYSAEEAMSPRSDMGTEPCHLEVTCACHLEDTCSYTSPKGEDITDNTLIDSIGTEAENFGTSTCDEDPIFVTLPCRRGVKSQETSYEVRESEVVSMEEAFPAVNVRQQYRQMLVWLNANRDRIKTYDGMKSFICKWLSREQDKGWRFEKASSSAKTANAAFDNMAVGGEISL